jgi:hypothetical protein
LTDARTHKVHARLREEVDNLDRETGLTLPDMLSKPNLKTTAELFKSEQFAQDLQSMSQIPFNEPADIVLDIFSDLLKKEIDMGSSTAMEARSDVLSGFLAQDQNVRQTTDKQFKSDSVFERNGANEASNVAHTGASKNISIGMRQDFESESSGRWIGESIAAGSVSSAKKREYKLMQRAQALDDITAEQLEAEGGKYAEVLEA